MTGFPKYWKWFGGGSGGTPGYRRLLNLWLLLHGAIGAALAWVVWVDLATAANTVLLPLVGVLVGLSFAWAGNAQALLQVREIEEMADRHPGGYPDYVYAYQTAILAILALLACWGIAGLRVFDVAWPTTARRVPYYLIKAALFTLSSLALRASWHVVLGAQAMLISRMAIRNSRRADEAGDLNLDDSPGI
jgi:hypothetical protein